MCHRFVVVCAKFLWHSRNVLPRHVFVGAAGGWVGWLGFCAVIGRSDFLLFAHPPDPIVHDLRLCLRSWVQYEADSAFLLRFPV